MSGLLIRWVINAVALLVISRIIRGIEIDGIVAALAAAAVIGVMNAIVRPILIFLTLPITILTLGLFILIINGLMVYLTGTIVTGFSVSGFFPPIFTAILLSVVSWISTAFISDRGRIEYIDPSGRR